MWVVCHGYRQLARRFIREFQGIAGAERRIVAPEGLSRFYLDEEGGPHGPEARVGATWMTREDRIAEIDDYVAYLDALAERESEQTDVGVRVALVYGAADPFVRAEAVAAQLETLRDLGTVADAHSFAGGHVMDAAVLADLAVPH